MNNRLGRKPAPWLRWLTPGLEVKRWLLLLGIAILILALGGAYLLRAVPDSSFIALRFRPRWVPAIILAGIGLSLLAFSVHKLQRSVLGPFLPGGSQRSMADVLYTYRSRNHGPRLVAIGGGIGMSMLLRGLKEHSANLTAIVTVAHDPGSSGLGDENGIQPGGDIRHSMVALADAEPLMKELFNHRFAEGSLNGHSIGNLFITAMAEVTGDFEHAVRESGRVLAIRGTIIPSTLQDVTSRASADAGTVVGESHIPQQNAPISSEAAAAISNAEVIVVAPGSLDTSILPNLLVPGMVEAITQSPALKVFVCDVASQQGKTDHHSVSECLRVLKQHTGSNLFDFVLVNSNLNHPPTGARVPVLFDYERAISENPRVRFIAGDVVDTRIPSRHDPRKLARVLMKRVCDIYVQPARQESRTNGRA